MSVQYSSRGRSKSLTPASSGGLQQPVNHLLGSRTGRRCTGRRANYAGARVLLGCGGMRAGVDLSIARIGGAGREGASLEAIPGCARLIKRRQPFGVSGIGTGSESPDRELSRRLLFTVIRCLSPLCRPNILPRIRPSGPFPHCKKIFSLIAGKCPAPAEGQSTVSTRSGSWRGKVARNGLSVDQPGSILTQDPL